MNSICLFVFWLTPVYANKVSVEAIAKDFAGQELVFYIYEDPFFDSKKVIARILVPPKGTFNLSFESEKTWCLYVEIGPYLGYFYAEPGYNYKIDLPEITRLPDDWKYNPYFQKVPFHINVLFVENSPHPDNILSTECVGSNGEEAIELNDAIRKFDQAFDPFLNKQILRYYNPRQSEEYRDSFINKIYTGLPVSDLNYYYRYTDAKKAILEFNVSDHNLDSLIKYYIQPATLDFQNPAYRELFRLLFDDYFNHLSKKENFREIFKIFSGFDYPSIKEYIQKGTVLENDSVFNLVLLHELYKAYYSDNYDKKSILKLLENFPVYTELETAVDISEMLIKRFTGTRAGFPAPSFTLNDINGNLLSLDSIRDKYILLGFCNTGSSDCLKEFEYLKYLHGKHSQLLKIITVIPSMYASDIQNFAKLNSFNWSIVSSSAGDKLMEDYRVKAMPVFYLIGKDGKLILSPSPNPSEGLEQRLFILMRDSGNLKPEHIK